MAVQFERNINLEETDSDALFGIEYLAHQTMAQKVIFWGCAIIGVAIFFVTQVIYGTPFLLSFFLSLVFLGIGFLFGANQNEHMTIGGYLKLVFFKPIKYANFMSTEDVTVMKNEADKLKVEEVREERKKAVATPEGQKRSLILVVVFMVVFIIFAFAILGLKSYKENHMTHHTVGYIMNQENS